ncbi:MAG: HAMP domain-containing protein [Actinomycetota bacterium]|nr:HAMP domain-containing protein [Actinomycetota bacterium]
MLRRLKIGGRVNMLIAVPLLALIAFAALSYIALERVSVRGEEYKALKKAQDLRASTAPPPASLLEAWAIVNHIGILGATIDGFTPDGIAIIDGELAKLDAAQVRFEESVAYWREQDLDERVAIRLLQIGGDQGEKFFLQVQEELKPAIASRAPQNVIRVIKSMEWRYNLQQTGVQRALAWVEPEVVAREESTDSYVGNVILFAGIATFGLLVLTVLLSGLVRRSIVGPIRRLATQAKSVATKDLPEVVQTVQDLPADSPVPHLPSFEVGTKDELAELGESFNSVQDAAVDLAAEQAMARRIVSENLVNIARRNQNLLGRTLGFISTLEQGERDPEVLDNLFRLDHLTTRMRRNAQSLLVLAGAEPTRLWAPTVAIGDVVRAALSEVENYGQVELADLGDIGVQGAVASEVAHLLAELMENATSFSPPTSAVTVVGRAVPDGHQLAIFDYGLGMASEELADANRRLNQVSSFDRESNKMLGFQVVARLAARHDIKVMLTTTPGGSGVTAIVRLPKSILEVMGAPGTMAPVVDVPAITERLSEPLPLTVSVGAAPALHQSPTQMTDEALWEAMRAPASASTAAPITDLTPTVPLTPVPMVSEPTPSIAPPAVPAAPAPVGSVSPVAQSEPLTTQSGLTKRVRGAQMPEVGSTPMEAPAPRPADEVRTTLASLQRGVDLGRQRQADS